MKRVINTGLLSVLIVSAACANVTAQNNQSPETTASLETTETVETAASTETAETFGTFADWCLNQANLTPEARHTVEVLLETAGTQDCYQAEVRLTNLNELELRQTQITDLALLPWLASLI